MNTYILGDVMAMHGQNHEKVINYICAKAECEWDKMVIVAKQCPSLSKPFLVKLISKQLLQVLGFNAYGMGNVLQNATSWMEKVEDL